MTPGSSLVARASRRPKQPSKRAVGRCPQGQEVARHATAALVGAPQGTNLALRLAELPLGDEAFGVGGEVALQVRPAQLAAAQRQVRICPRAIGGDDRLGVGEQFLGAILVAIGAI